MTDELQMDFTVESCAQCPMQYDGYCLHPSRSSERISDCDEYDYDPHPLCPLREMPILLRVKP